LIERFVHSRFDEKYLTTIGVKISQKLLPPVENPKTGNFVEHHFLVWDIAAMEKFDTVAKNYYRGAAGALAVIDLTCIETILALEEICEKFYSVCPKAELIMVGNKSDLFDSSPETFQQLQKTAATLSTSYLLTSAKMQQELNQQRYLLLLRESGASHVDRRIDESLLGKSSAIINVLEMIQNSATFAAVWIS
jgi:GTPase SAR1 family protein